ncbi:hypothetical protein ST47_g3673 [Ascochyta rabiei]|uniref:Px domain containing protein n=1 Tax=Didymella rabiei TaxID=5454 RepID=A0A163H5T8_DIDRA|nr:hypothetical protein ST47_g3673 [Ascochyta rabiei]
MSSTSALLAPAQTHALFDILIHHQLYAEIEAFKYPSTINHYGYPFRKADGVQTTSPLLQNMLNKFALTNPALKNLDNSFWQDKIQALVARMAEAELSESYDKGAIGSRKALATAASSIAEYIGRGMLGGYPVALGEGDGKKQYDTNKPGDVLEAWEECARTFIYGDLLDQLLEKVTATDKLEDHSSLVQAGHEFILLNVASFLHHIFVMSPDGQYLVRLLENIHRLIPYYMIKQTLRVGNAASMINGMVRLILAKLSVTAMTNWIGLTNNSNDGMNLMQQIISTILAWDTAEFQKRASKLESMRDAPDKKVMKAIKAHVYASRDRHEAARNMSIQEEKSIVAIILDTADTRIKSHSLKEHQHDIAMEYYSTYLSIRDREEITKVFCKSNPDVLTSAVRDCVSAMDPVIRSIHNAVDLSSTVTDAENFITDLVKASKPKKKSGRKSRETSKEREADNGNVETPPASVTDSDNGDAPTVEDFVVLLRKHAPALHKFLHQVTKNAPDLAHDYLVYAKQMFGEFKADDKTREGGAGNMTGPLHSLFETLPKEKQEELKKLLDEHAEHLGELKDTSHSRLESIMNNGKTKGSTHGPGMYLSRWNALLDSTLITPATLSGPVRRGWEVKGELDGKGLKTSSALQSSKGGKTANGVSIANGLGDAQDRKERKRDSMEEDKMATVWEAMRDGWVGVCRGLEVMGS